MTPRVFLALAVALLLCGGIPACGLFSPGVEARAAAYYNFMVGRTPRTLYTSFLSPAYKGTFQPDSLKALDEYSRVETQPNERYPAARARDVQVEARDQFAYTAIDPGLGDAYANLQPQRWVRDGSRWYMYMGSDAEVSAYGIFPADLYPPRLAPAADAAEE